MFYYICNSLLPSSDSQMFLLSTVLCQVTLSLTSSFPMAVGQMMVENIPFMHVISHIAVQNQGKSYSYSDSNSYSNSQSYTHS